MGDVEDKVDREAREEHRDDDHTPPRRPAEQPAAEAAQPKNTRDAARKMRAMFGKR
ncbi:hypothetical protein [Spirillospora albida]|uniref:hypothetical protein n=1 Tax=Spirillospora albida TaxID=58123 RepID=UPI0012FBA15D|nr:hypothetical protein [Spirillospora albida]